MDRRAFIGSLAVAGLGQTLPVGGRAVPGSHGAPPSVAGMVEDDASGLQRLHPDAQTDPQGVEYFFLGNGKMTAVIQHATGPALEMGLTPLGLLLWDHYHFARKWSTFTFHPEWGLKRGMITVQVGDEAFAVEPDSLSVTRAYPDGVPTVVARWQAGPYPIVERYWMTAEAPLLWREVALENPTGQAVPVAFTTTLYHNHILFTDYQTDHAAGVLRADGYPHVELFAHPRPALNDRYMTVEAGQALAGGTAQAQFLYVIRTRKEAVEAVPRAAYWQAAAQYWDDFATVETPQPGLDHLYRAARDTMRAAVSEAGRYDASIWQYNMEWVIDATGVIIAASQTGQFALAAAVLDNCLTRLVNEKGIAAHASRFRDNLETELNQQGALLGAAWTYWAWSGDLTLLRRHWPTLRRVAEFPLGPRYLHESGLVHANIEFFERDGAAGVLPGFDLAHQSLVAWGLEKAAALAKLVGDDASAARWAEAGRTMREAMLHHPTYALVEDGQLIKRRLLDGSRQRTLSPNAVGSDHIPAESPLAREDEPLLDPDISLLYPILLGQLDPDDPVAQKTVAAVKTLWNASGTGGYLRYHPSSDPDAPGGWTFPTAIVGRVLARAGHADAVRQVLDWFQQVQGSRGGAFFEIYARAPRPVPPLPPMGIIVWGWAEIASLFVEGLLGAVPVPERDTLRVQPHLPSGLDAMQGRLRFRTRQVDVRVRRASGPPRAAFEGQTLPYETDGVMLPAPLTDGTLEVTIP